MLWQVMIGVLLHSRLGERASDEALSWNMPTRFEPNGAELVLKNGADLHLWIMGWCFHVVEYRKCVISADSSGHRCTVFFDLLYVNFAPFKKVNIKLPSIHFAPNWLHIHFSQKMWLFQPHEVIISFGVGYSKFQASVLNLWEFILNMIHWLIFVLLLNI